MQIVYMIAGSFISGIVGVGISYYTIKRTNYTKARSEFIVSFVDEIIFITDNIPMQNIDPTYNPAVKYTTTLLKSRSKHRKAIEVFGQYISSEKYNKIYNAYENYYNPRHKKETLEIINTLSFGLYNMDKNEVKNSIGREISGLELALKNINKIVELA